MYVAIAIAVVAAIVAVQQVLANQALSAKLAELEHRAQTLKDGQSSAKKELAAARSAQSDVTEALNSLKADHKKAKQRLHQLTKGGGKGRAQATAGKSGHAQALRTAREELGAALQQIEGYKQHVKQLEEAKRSAESKLAAPEPPPVAQETEETREAKAQDVREELEQKLKTQRQQAEAKRKETLAENRDLKRRLSRALTEIDKQRGRADNNEKAYIITKNQLEGALDRLHEFDPSVPRPFKAPPGEKQTSKPSSDDAAAPAAAGKATAGEKAEEPPKKAAAKAKKAPKKAKAPVEKADTGPEHSGTEGQEGSEAERSTEKDAEAKAAAKKAKAAAKKAKAASKKRAAAPKKADEDPAAVGKAVPKAEPPESAPASSPEKPADPASGDAAEAPPDQE